MPPVCAQVADVLDASSEAATTLSDDDEVAAEVTCQTDAQHEVRALLSVSCEFALRRLCGRRLQNWWQ